MLTHQRPQACNQGIDVPGCGEPTVTGAPRGGECRVHEEALHVIALCLAHIASRRGGIDGDAFGGKRLDERLDRRFAAEVDHRPRPIEDDQLEAFLETHAATPMSNRLVANSSPIAKPVDAPEPLVTIATRTAASGASINTGRSSAAA